MTGERIPPRHDADDSTFAVLQQCHARIDEVLLRVIGPVGTKICLLDVPVHKNAGDTLIWEGEIETFKRIGYDVSFQDSAIPPLRDITATLTSEMVIVLHGGGNFGDLWPRHQKYREKIAREYPQHRMVFLSQSVHFKDEKLAEASNESLSMHPDLTLLVRDKISMQKAAMLFPGVKSEYCLDMAFGNQPVQRKFKKLVDVVVLDRKDRESLGALVVPKSFSVSITDWRQGLLSAIGWHLSVAVHVSAKLLPVAISKHLQWLLSTNLSWMRSLTLNSAVKTISSGRVLLTNRLHAQVLAGFFGIPAVVLDNNYGKIRPIFEEYGWELGRSALAESNEEALSWVDAFLKP